MSRLNRFLKFVSNSTIEPEGESEDEQAGWWVLMIVSYVSEYLTERKNKSAPLANLKSSFTFYLDKEKKLPRSLRDKIWDATPMSIFTHMDPR